jgi:hypothetical protein
MRPRRSSWHVPQLALVAGCAAQPMTRERAARLCADEARAADGISGSIGVGAGSEGGLRRAGGW